MVDRIIDLPNKEVLDVIKKRGYAWFVEDDNDDYLSDDAILVLKEEVIEYVRASEACYKLYVEALDHVAKFDLWSKLGLPPKIVTLIKHDLKRGLPHVCGRLDLAGGVEGIPIKLIEFNADTSALMPESAYFQAWMHKQVEDQFKERPFNFLIRELTKVFKDLKSKFSDRPATLLLCSLGFEEDRLNLNVIKDAAELAGFAVDYANLEDVVFAEDGVFLEGEDDDGDTNYVQYHFVYKQVPWEIIMLDEPELMDILVDLSVNHDLIVLNPSYSIAFQAKHMLSILHELHPTNRYLLPTFDSDWKLKGKKYVSKVNFGRFGENIDVIGPDGDILSQTDGDFGNFSKVYQEFADMYQDEDGDIYQAAMYTCNGKASCLCFRRRDGLIIDDDSEFVTHVVFGS